MLLLALITCREWYSSSWGFKETTQALFECKEDGSQAELIFMERLPKEV